MKFVILGAGALGSILAAHLIRAGHDVVVAARGARADQLRRDGLSIKGLAEFSGLECDVVTDPASISATDVFVVTPKTYHIETAIAPYAHVAMDAVFSVANGVVKNDQLAHVFGAEKVLGCMADFSGELLETGEVLFTRNQSLPLGELDGQMTDRVMRVASTINASGINCAAVDDIESREWSKFVGWCAWMVPGVLTRLETWRYMADPDTARIGVRAAREVASLAAAKGITLQGESPLPVARLTEISEDEAVDIVTARGAEMKKSAAGHRISTLQDLERGKPLEVEETLGWALKRGREFGLDMPTLETVYPLIRGMSRINVATDE